MTMIEIQEMSVNMERGIARIPELFRNRQSIFSKWSEKDHCSAFRITCIPLRKMPDPGRLFGKVNQDLTFKRYRAQIDGHKVDIQHPITASQVKPILRGARFYSNGSGGSMVVDQLQDGTVDIQFKSDYRDPGFRGKDEFVLYHLWIIGSVAMALEMLDRLRFLAGVPNSEYAMEIEIAQHSANDAPPLEYRGPLNSYGTDAYRIDELPILIRDILVEGVHDFDQVISRIDTDIYDAIGVRNKPREIHIDWAGY